ncbi:MAG TPA: hypothetical protein PL084_11500 [Chitinophagales bacterium]|nr:hypothetical protein [Chitinophagales bacterium]
MRLMSNNPTKRVGLIGYGLEIVENVPIEILHNNFNKKYLEAKRDTMGHEIMGKKKTAATKTTATKAKKK